jgi:hypothetical protein
LYGKIVGLWDVVDYRQGHVNVRRELKFRLNAEVG